MAGQPTFKLINSSRNDGNPSAEMQEEMYFVEFPDKEPVDISVDIYGNPTCPTYFDPHPRNPNYFVVGRNVIQDDDSPQLYRLTLQYSNKYNNPSGEAQNGQPSSVQFQWIQNPLSRPANVEFDSYRSKRLMEMTYDDNDNLSIPVQSTAGETFAIEEDISYRLIVFSKNVQRVNPIFSTKMDFLNTDTVRLGSGGAFIAKPFTLWLTDVKFSSLIIENRVPYYTMNFKLYHNPETWIRKFRNVGFMEAEYFRCKLPGSPLNPRPRFSPYQRRLKKIRMADGDQPATPVAIVSRKLIDAGIMQIVGQNGGPPIVGQAVRISDACGNTHIPAPESDGVGGLPQGFWQHNMLEFRTREKLRFTGNIPLR